MKKPIYQHALDRLRAAATVAEVDYLVRAYHGLCRQSHLSTVELVRLYGIANGVKSNIRTQGAGPAFARLVGVDERVYKRRLPSGKFVTVIDERRAPREQSKSA